MSGLTDQICDGSVRLDNMIPIIGTWRARQTSLEAWQKSLEFMGDVAILPLRLTPLQTTKNICNYNS